MTMSRMRFMRWTHLLAVTALAGCASPPPAPRSIEGVAEGYVRVALQLAQHDPSLVEAWRGDAAWRPGPRLPVAGLASSVDDLRRTLEAIPPKGDDLAPRHHYLSGQLRALHFAARRLMGDAASVDDQAREEFGLELRRFEPAQMTTIRAAIDRALPGPGSTVARFEALKQRTIVPATLQGPVMAGALAACRAATTAVHALPSGERVTVAFPAGLGWDGYAQYEGGGHTAIQVSGDAPLDVARALRLACHEGYPGHHVQHLSIDQLGWPELELTPGFGPHLLYAEGAAEAGADLAFSTQERARIYREELLPAAGLPRRDAETLATLDELVAGLHPVVTDVAREYLDRSLPREQAIERLRHEALVLNAEATLAMIERRRARALVYTEGAAAIYARMSTRNLPGLQDLLSRAIALQ